MISGPNGWRQLRICLVRSRIRGSCAPYLLIGTTALSAVAVTMIVRVDTLTAEVAGFGLLAVLGLSSFGLRALYRKSFEEPASARAIADLLSLEPEAMSVRPMLPAYHAAMVQDRGFLLPDRES